MTYVWPGVTQMAIIAETSTGSWNEVVLMLGQRRRRWANIKPALGERMNNATNEQCRLACVA